MDNSNKADLIAVRTAGEFILRESTYGTLSLVDESKVVFAPLKPGSKSVDIPYRDIVRVEPTLFGLNIITASERFYFKTVPLDYVKAPKWTGYFFGLAWSELRKSGTKQWIAQLEQHGVKVSSRGRVRFWSFYVGSFLLTFAVVYLLITFLLNNGYF